MKTALLISYYWPPSGGAGVQRWLKMSRYMHQFGWKLVIYTPSNPAFPVEDLSLLAEIRPQLEVIKHPIWEPHGLYKRVTRRPRNTPVYSGFINETGDRSLVDRLSIWARGNLFIPDPRRFWIRPSVKRLGRLLDERPFAAIISTGPPHSTHLIAHKLATGRDIPWVADFRDPWTGIDYYQELMLTRVAHRTQRKLELQVLTAASAVVTVSRSWAGDLAALSGRQVQVISNGFDELDFATPAPPLDREFTICHIGSMNRDRNPHALWQALARLRQARHPLMDRVRVELLGTVDNEVSKAIAANELQGMVQRSSFVRHDQAIARMRASQVLLLPINRSANAAGVIPGKFFEYLGANRPILLIGPPAGDAADILRRCHAGETVDFEDAAGVERILVDWYRRFDEGALQFERGNICAYSRRTLAGQYATLLAAIMHGGTGRESL